MLVTSVRVRSSARLLAIWLAVGAAGLACGGTTRFSLLPPVHASSRDPNPTRPLVEPEVAPPRSENDGRTPKSPGLIGNVDAAVSGSAVLSWLLGGAAPLVGIYGTFDETTWFGRKPAAGAPEPAPTPPPSPSPDRPR